MIAKFHMEDSSMWIWKKLVFRLPNKLFFEKGKNLNTSIISTKAVLNAVLLLKNKKVYPCSSYKDSVASRIDYTWSTSCPSNNLQGLPNKICITLPRFCLIVFINRDFCYVAF